MDLTFSAGGRIEGAFDSVFSATWSYVVDDEENKVFKMKVVQGAKPPSQWTKEEVQHQEEHEEEDETVSGRLRLMVLRSESGWPYTGFETKDEMDCYIRPEIRRVWDVVEADLAEWFAPKKEKYYTPTQRVLIGTPGIGKSAGAGSYLLYQLLHYDTERIQVVAYFIGDTAYVFDKKAEKIIDYIRQGDAADALCEMSDNGVKGYVICDVCKASPPSFKIPKDWGVIVLTPPNEDNYKEWAKQRTAFQVIINCPTTMDIKAMCAWRMQGSHLQEQQEFLEDVMDRVDVVGPLPRYVFDRNAYKSITVDFYTTLNSIDRLNAHLYKYVYLLARYQTNKDSYELTRIVRFFPRDGVEGFYNAPISGLAKGRIKVALGRALLNCSINFWSIIPRDLVLSNALEIYGSQCFLSKNIVRELCMKLRELKPSGKGAKPCVLQTNEAARPIITEAIPRRCLIENKIRIRHRVQYVPCVLNFPLVDAFFFVNSTTTAAKLLVGLQTTSAGEHHTETSTVMQFERYLSKTFEGWEEYSKDLSWEIIYLQHVDSRPITVWKKCNIVKNNDEEHKRVAEFWEKKVRQYQVAVSSDDNP